MNEAAKTIIGASLNALPDGKETNFDTGTAIGEKAAKQAVVQFIFDDPGSVTPRAELES